MGDVYRYVGNRMRELRTSFGGKGISQEELARAIKVTPNTISRWETSAYKPDLHDLESVARFFDVSIFDLLPPEVEAADEEVSALLRAARALPAEDIKELRRYAEFRRARHALSRKGGAPRDNPEEV